MTIAFVDRIEGDVAVVEFGTETVDIALEDLPLGVQEGSRLSVTWGILDEEAPCPTPSPSR